MSTHQTTVESTPTSAAELMLQLQDVPGITSVNSCTYEARKTKFMRAAVNTLHRAGYVLSYSRAIEGHFYQLEYTPLIGSYSGTGRWPYLVKLRLIVDDAAYPPLVLCYRDDNGDLCHYDGSYYQSVYKTGTPTAEKMLSSFARDYPDKVPHWLPALGTDGTWLPL